MKIFIDKFCRDAMHRVSTVRRIRRTFATSVIFAAICFIASFAAVPAYAATGTMNIGGVTAVSDLTQNQTGTGWTWTASTATLTLDNSYTGYNIRIVCQSTDDITLVYAGDIAITGAGSAVNCQGNLTISGSGGVLTLTGGSSGDGLTVEGALQILGGSVSVGGGYGGVYAKNGLTVSGAASLTANATGTNGNGLYTYDGDVVISTAGTVSAGGKGTGFAVNAMKSGVPATGLLDISGGTVTLTNSDTPANLISGGLNHTGGTLNGTATVNYNTGSFDNVIGNDGIGGVASLPDNNVNASGNTVNVTGGTVNNGIYGGLHYTANGDPATAGNNTVDIGSSFSGHSNLDVYGGDAMVDSHASAAGKTAAATGNTVNIAGGTFSDVMGGQASSSNGLANAGNNTVNFTGGTASNIYGGVASINSPGSTAASTATGNSVFISGGTVNGYVYGGYSNIGAGIGSATGNTVTISGAPTMTAAKLYGGYVNDAYTSPVSTDAFTGNILNWNTSGLTISELGNFAEYNFTLPASIAAGSTVITASDGYSMSAIDVAGATVGIAFDGALSLAVGDKITLIDGGAYGVTGTPATTSLTASGYDFAIAVESDKLVATVTAPGGVTLPVPVFHGLADEYTAGSPAVPLKVAGTGSESLTVFKVNGTAATELNPATAGAYRVEAASADGKLRIWKYVQVK